MDKIDLKDRKILYELDKNARQTLSQIGKNVRLPKSSNLCELSILYSGK